MTNHFGCWCRAIFKMAAASLFMLAVANAQSFSSGSTGSDGALNLTTPGTIVFDPKSFNPPLDPNGTNVYNFTTINIAAGVTVKLSASVINAPVFWLASGNVEIDGTISLDGDDGQMLTSPSQRRATVPGSGGYAGGLAGYLISSTERAAPQSGGGPGAGTVDCSSGLGCVLTPATWAGSNQFLVPLIGGSGGAGNPYGCSGGAGGGAILIASSTSITVNGNISSAGGSPAGGPGPPCNGSSGGGAGGAIRVVSNTISGSGTLSTSKPQTNPGAIRLEAFSFSGSVANNYNYRASPFNTFLPPNSAAGTVQITMVGGVAVPPSPTGSFQNPDITLNSSTAVVFNIQGQNIPLGTVVKLYIASENGMDQIINSSPLSGTLASSTATASAVLPSGFSLSSVRATWTQ